jgi:methylenetetrahydrofolate reductase (NADPH)
MSAADDRCPKHMVYGPCGGVRSTGACELDRDLACPFVTTSLRTWTGPSQIPLDTGLPSVDHPIVMTDLRVRAYDADGIRNVARTLAATSDVILVGDHQNRPDFPPSFVAALLLEVGAEPWVVLTCRDRNRIALESEVAALSVLGVRGAHCVTGDARGAGVRGDAGVFDLDSVQLAALVRGWGLRPSVAATPAAPPVHLRPPRLREKQRAGACLCIVNHAGGPASVARFAGAARAAGSTLPLIACVPLFTDPGSAAVLAGFPGVELDPGVVAYVLGAADPVEAGINAAVALAGEMLRIDGVIGVNLSGAATAGSEVGSAAIIAETATRVRDAATQ